MTELVLDVIESYNQYIKQVSPGCIHIANTLRENQINEALPIILQFTEGMTWLAQAQDLLTKNGVQVELEIEKIHEYLNEINNGLSIQDYVLVADMFEYEIATYFEELELIAEVQ